MTMRSRNIQHGTIDHHDERKMCIILKIGGQRRRLHCHIEEKRGSIHCRPHTDLTICSLVPGSYNLVQLISMMKGRCLLYNKVDC